MSYTEKDTKRLLEEVKANQQTVVLMCDEHNYTPGGQMPPTSGCKGCWMVYYMDMYAKTPPHLRERRLAELQSVVHALVQDIKTGNTDFEIYRNPRMKYTKGVN